MTFLVPLCPNNSQFKESFDPSPSGRSLVTHRTVQGFHLGFRNGITRCFGRDSFETLERFVRTGGWGHSVVGVLDPVYQFAFVCNFIFLAVYNSCLRQFLAFYCVWAPGPKDVFLKKRSLWNSSENCHFQPKSLITMRILSNYPTSANLIRLLRWFTVVNQSRR